MQKQGKESVRMRFTLYFLHRRTSRGGEGGCPPPPPSYRNFSNISGKTLMIRAKVHGRKYSKMLSKPDLKATFSDVCLVKTE